MIDKRVSIRGLIAALEDAQAERWQYIEKSRVLALCDHLEASPMNDPFAVSGDAPPAEPGCPHAKTVDIGTMQQPGGKLCLECNQQV